MRASFTSSLSQNSRSAARSVIPQWISDMGLEWLYLLLSKSDRKGRVGFN